MFSSTFIHSYVPNLESHAEVWVNACRTTDHSLPTLSSRLLPPLPSPTSTILTHHTHTHTLAHTFRRRPNKAQQEQARGSVIGGKLQPGALGVHIKTHTNFTAVIVMRTHSHQGNGQIPPMVIHNHQKRGGGQQAKAL